MVGWARDERGGGIRRNDCIGSESEEEELKGEEAVIM